MVADYSIVKIMCPVETYDRIHIEIQSAIDHLEHLVDVVENGSSGKRDLINALEHLRIAKIMADEGDGYSSKLLEEVHQPELGLEEQEESCEDEEEEEE